MSSDWVSGHNSGSSGFAPLPRRAAWDEGWCAETGSDGMDIPEAWRRSKEKKSKKDKKDGEEGK